MLGPSFALSTFDGGLLTGWSHTCAPSTNFPLSPASELEPPPSRLEPPASSSGFGSPVVPQLLLESRLAGKSTGVCRPDLQPLGPASLVESALPKNASVSIIESALPNSQDLNPPGMNTYKKLGEGTPLPAATTRIAPRAGITQKVEPAPARAAAGQFRYCHGFFRRAVAREMRLSP